MYPREYFDTFWRPDIKNQVFVAMSFDPTKNLVWEYIFRPAIQEAGLEAYRTDISNLSSDIVTEIMEGIAHSRIILADLTAMNGDRPNPNVMYEIGLAHALRQASEVILVRSDDHKMLFDVSSIRVQQYDIGKPEIAKAHIKELIITSLKEIDLLKSLKVKMAIDVLDDSCIELMRQYASHDGFFIIPPNTMGDILVSLRNRFAIPRLLELGIVRCDAQTEQDKVAYIWTNFGQVVLKQMKFR